VKSSGIGARLAKLGIELPPEPSTVGANYVPFVQTGNLVFVTGQLSSGRLDAELGEHVLRRRPIH
jgi:hypothetical protein